jgi:hypothetical protein|tara:strand:+ start:473 stop:1006 length:534 start_codon:yes stop_codon:yes gene_type:complete
MKEVKLTKTSIFHQDLSSLSKLDNKKLKIDCIVFHETYEGEFGYDKDIEIPNDQQVDWLSDHMRHHFDFHYNRALQQCLPHTLLINDPNEGTVLRSHNLYLQDISKTPEIIGIYFVEADEKDEIIFHYDDHIQKDLMWRMPIKSKKFVLFHSSLKYYLPPNPSKKKRIALLFHYQVR